MKADQTRGLRDSATQRRHTAKESFLEAARNSGVTVIGSYVDTDTPVECLCSNGHQCFPSPHSVAMGRGFCFVCGTHLKRKANPQTEFAKFLYDAMSRLGMTQLKLANEMGCSGMAVRNYLTGKAFPRKGLLEKMSKSLDVEVVFLETLRPTTSTFTKDLAKEYFLDKAKADGVQVVGQYVDTKTKVECICPEGHTCFPMPNTIWNLGSGWCVICGNVQSAKTRTGRTNPDAGKGSLNRKPGKSGFKGVHQNGRS